MVDAASLSARTILVTGASSGLGAHFAKSLAARGAALGLAARRTERLAALAQDIEAAGGRCLAIPMDVEDPASIAAAFDALEQAFGTVHGLVNNAGLNRDGAALSLSAADFETVFRVNVTGAFVCAQECARRLIAAGADIAREGRIVNIASIGAFTVLPGLSAYCASKAALVALTRSLAREWARHGIAVNAICPGYIETEINAEWLASEGGRRMVAGFARRRLLNAHDLDAPLALLLGAQSAYVTGSIITIDDGQSL